MTKQITLPKVKLEDFLQLSSYIDTNRVLETVPITSQIKIEIIFGNCKMTKTNVNNFVVYSFDIDEEDIEMLVNEKKLRSFLEFSKGDKIQIIEKETSVIFNDGYFKPNHAKEIFEFKNFPATPKLKPDNSIIFDKTLINLLGIGKTFVSRDELRPTFLYVHLKNKMIFSSTLILNYSNKIDKDYGEKLISLSPNECKLMSNFDEVEYYFNENFSILKCNDVYYGSQLKTDIQDLSNTFNQFNNSLDKEKYMRILVSDIYNFCNSTCILAKGLKDCFINATLTVISENEIKFEFTDAGNIENPMTFNAEIKNIPIGYTFAFSQESLKQLFDTLKYDDICISPVVGNANQFGVWSDRDSNFIAIVCKMQNL